MKKEQGKWLHEIEGYENCKGYKIYNDGTIVSYKKRLGRGLKISDNPQRVIKSYPNTKGYLLFEASPRRVIKVHRVVALAFIDNPLNKPQVNHIDGNKQNNNVSNLEWVTNGENQSHAIRNGLKRVLRGEENYQYNKEHSNCKKVNQYSFEGVLINSFVSIAQAARSIGKNPSGISKCINGKTSSYEGYIWRQNK